ncbi:MAG: site-specific integrase [Coriobacteriia bacterium]|nr:site-specific integrase [Coriobacteriia bacterium]
MPRRFEGQRLVTQYEEESRGRWTCKARAILGTHPDGRRNEPRTTFRGTKAECAAKARAWYEALLVTPEKDLLGKQQQTVKTYLETWLATKKATVKLTTWKRYDSLIRTSIEPALGPVRLCDLSRDHIERYMASCYEEQSTRHTDAKVSPKTIRNRLGVLASAMRRAERDGLIARSPLEGVDLPKRRRPELVVMREEDAAALLEAVEGSDIEVLAWTALHTGARLGELLALRWRDVDLSADTIHIARTLVEDKTSGDDWYYFTSPKSGRTRTIELDPETVARLKAHKKTVAEQRLKVGAAWRTLDLVFPNVWQQRQVAPGTPLRPTTATRIFRRIADDAELEGVRFHDLRHAHATFALRAGQNPLVVSRRLGHADVQTTLSIYAHVLPGDDMSAAVAVADVIQKARAAR